MSVVLLSASVNYWSKRSIRDFFIVIEACELLEINLRGVAKAVLIITTDLNGFHGRAVHEAMFKIRKGGDKRLYGQTDLL